MVFKFFNEAWGRMGVIDPLDPPPELLVLLLKMSDLCVTEFEVFGRVTPVVTVLSLRNRKNTRTNAAEQSSTDETPEKIITAVWKLAGIVFHGSQPLKATIFPLSAYSCNGVTDTLI